MHRLTFKFDNTNAEDDSLVAYQFEGLRARAETTHAVFTRKGGASSGRFSSLNISSAVKDDDDAVVENNRRMLHALGYRREDVVAAWLVHSSTVALITWDDVGAPLHKVDALITRERGLPLRMCFADCVPIVFYDPRKQAIGFAHAGWRGVASNVGAATVQSLVEAYGSEPRHIWVGIGPAICVEHYEVSQDVVDQVAAACPRGTRLTQPGNNGRPHLDLAAAVTSQLEAAGVGSIENSGLCTASNIDEWYSHRAEKGVTGRFGLVLALNS